MNIETRGNFKEIIKNKNLSKNLYFNSEYKTTNLKNGNRSSLGIQKDKIILKQSLPEIGKKTKDWSITDFIQLIEKIIKEKRIKNSNNLIFEYKVHFNENGELFINDI